MREAATDAIAARAQKADGIGRTLSASVAAHVVFVAAVVFIPRAFPPPPKPATIMVMTLGAGVPGPKTTGVTAIGSQPVEAVAPPPKRAEVIPPVAPTPTAMPEPKPAVKKPDVKPVTPPKATPPAPPAPRKATTGPQVSKGTAVAKTDAQNSMSTGLATGPGGTNVAINAPPDFCCQEYIDIMDRRLQESIMSYGLQDRGEVKMQFTIEKDGTVTGIESQLPSTFPELNGASMRALKALRLGPLPPAFTGPRLTVQLTFYYK